MLDALSAPPTHPRSRRRYIGAAILLTYVMRALLALVLGWPLARLLADPTLALPRGDRVLFDDGGLYLAEVARLYQAQLLSVAEGSLPLWLLVAYGGLVPLGALLATLAGHSELGPRHLARQAFGALGPLSLLLGVSIIAAAVCWTFPAVVFGLLETKISQRLGDVGFDLVQGGFRALALSAVIAVGVLHDLARAAAVRDEVGAFAAATIGWSTMSARGWAAAAGWCGRALAGVALVAGAAWISARVGVETNLRLAVVCAVHQVVALALVGLRAHWLAHALRLLPRPAARDRFPGGAARRDRLEMLDD